MGLSRAMAKLFAIGVCVMVMGAGSALAEGGSKILVLLDSLDMQQTHSKCLQSIKSKASSVEIASVDTKSIKLNDWDEWLFDKLVIFGGKSKLGPGVKPATIKDFFNAGNDVFLALSEDATTQLRELAAALGVDVSPAGTAVIDHFSFDAKLDQKSGTHTAVLSSAFSPLPVVFSSGAQGPILFKGLGLSVSPDSETAFHAVTGSSTAYAGPPGKPAPPKAPLAGKALGLVTLVQGRNGARVAVSGSTAMLSNEFFAAAAGNAKVGADVLAWAFRQRGVLRAGPLRHRIVGGEESPSIYRVSDEVEVAVDIEECGAGGCKPYQADDVQLEFTMLDPHIRVTLAPLGNGTFAAAVKIPDVYGVFKWVLEYRRPGFSWLSEVLTVPVRPFRHHEYERFIVQAYPYYASAASMMAGFFAVGFLFLYSR